MVDGSLHGYRCVDFGCLEVADVEVYGSILERKEGGNGNGGRRGRRLLKVWRVAYMDSGILIPNCCELGVRWS